MNHYDTLELKRGAADAEIKAAYRRLARHCHPDRNPGDSEKAERFKRIAAAWEVLGDPKKRVAYDEGLGAGHGEARAFVERGAVDGIGWFAARAQERVATLGKYGEKGKKAAKAAELGLEVGKEILSDGLRRLIRGG